MRDLRIQADLRSFQISHSVHVQAMASTAASNDATLLLNSSNTIQPTASGQSPKSGECAPRPRRHIDSQVSSGGPNTDQTFSNQAQPYSRNALRAEAKNSELSTIQISQANVKSDIKNNILPGGMSIREEEGHGHEQGEDKQEAESHERLLSANVDKSTLGNSSQPQAAGRAAVHMYNFTPKKSNDKVEVRAQQHPASQPPKHVLPVFLSPPTSPDDAPSISPQDKPFGEGRYNVKGSHCDPAIAYAGGEIGDWEAAREESKKEEVEPLPQSFHQLAAPSQMNPQTHWKSPASRKNRSRKTRQKSGQISAEKSPMAPQHTKSKNNQSPAFSNDTFITKSQSVYDSLQDFQDEHILPPLQMREESTKLTKSGRNSGEEDADTNKGNPKGMDFYNSKLISKPSLKDWLKVSVYENLKKPEILDRKDNPRLIRNNYNNQGLVNDAQQAHSGIDNSNHQYLLTKVRPVDKQSCNYYYQPDRDDPKAISVPEITQPNSAKFSLIQPIQPKLPSKSGHKHNSSNTRTNPRHARTARRARQLSALSSEGEHTTVIADFEKKQRDEEAQLEELLEVLSSLTDEDGEQTARRAAQAIWEELKAIPYYSEWCARMAMRNENGNMTQVANVRLQKMVDTNATWTKRARIENQPAQDDAATDKTLRDLMATPLTPLQRIMKATIKLAELIKLQGTKTHLGTQQEWKLATRVKDTRPTKAWQLESGDVKYAGMSLVIYTNEGADTDEIDLESKEGMSVLMIFNGIEAQPVNHQTQQHDTAFTKIINNTVQDNGSWLGTDTAVGEPCSVPGCKVLCNAEGTNYTMVPAIPSQIQSKAYAMLTGGDSPYDPTRANFLHAIITKLTHALGMKRVCIGCAYKSNNWTRSNKNVYDFKLNIRNLPTDGRLHPYNLAGGEVHQLLLQGALSDIREEDWEALVGGDHVPRATIIAVLNLVIKYKRATKWVNDYCTCAPLSANTLPAGNAAAEDAFEQLFPGPMPDARTLDEKEVETLLDALWANGVLDDKDGTGNGTNTITQTPRVALPTSQMVASLTRPSDVAPFIDFPTKLNGDEWEIVQEMVAMNVAALTAGKDVDKNISPAEIQTSRVWMASTLGEQLRAQPFNGMHGASIVPSALWVECLLAGSPVETKPIIELTSQICFNFTHCGSTIYTPDYGHYDNGVRVLTELLVELFRQLVQRQADEGLDENGGLPATHSGETLTIIYRMFCCLNELLRVARGPRLEMFYFYLRSVPNALSIYEAAKQLSYQDFPEDTDQPQVNFASLSHADLDTVPGEGQTTVGELFFRAIYQFTHLPGVRAPAVGRCGYIHQMDVDSLAEHTETLRARHGTPPPTASQTVSYEDWYSATDKEARCDVHEIMAVALVHALGEQGTRSEQAEGARGTSWEEEYADVPLNGEDSADPAKRESVLHAAALLTRGHSIRPGATVTGHTQIGSDIEPSLLDLIQRIGASESKGHLKYHTLLRMGQVYPQLMCLRGEDAFDSEYAKRCVAYYDLLKHAYSLRENAVYLGAAIEPPLADEHLQHFDSLGVAPPEEMQCYIQKEIEFTYNVQGTMPGAQYYKHVTDQHQVTFTLAPTKTPPPVPAGKDTNDTAADELSELWQHVTTAAATAATPAPPSMLGTMPLIPSPLLVASLTRSDSRDPRLQDPWKARLLYNEPLHNPCLADYWHLHEPTTTLQHSRKNLQQERRESFAAHQRAARDAQREQERQDYLFVQQDMLREMHAQEKESLRDHHGDHTENEQHPFAYTQTAWDNAAPPCHNDAYFTTPNHFQQDVITTAGAGATIATLNEATRRHPMHMGTHAEDMGRAHRSDRASQSLNFSAENPPRLHHDDRIPVTEQTCYHPHPALSSLPQHTSRMSDPGTYAPNSGMKVARFRRRSMSEGNLQKTRAAKISKRANADHPDPQISDISTHVHRSNHVVDLPPYFYRKDLGNVKSLKNTRLRSPVPTRSIKNDIINFVTPSRVMSTAKKSPPRKTSRMNRLANIRSRNEVSPVERLHVRKLAGIQADYTGNNRCSMGSNLIQPQGINIQLSFDPSSNDPIPDHIGDLNKLAPGCKKINHQTESNTLARQVPSRSAFGQAATQVGGNTELPKQNEEEPRSAWQVLLDENIRKSLEEKHIDNRRVQNKCRQEFKSRNRRSRHEVRITRGKAGRPPKMSLRGGGPPEEENDEQNPRVAISPRVDNGECSHDSELHESATDVQRENVTNEMTHVPNSTIETLMHIPELNISNPIVRRFSTRDRKAPNRFNYDDVNTRHPTPYPNEKLTLTHTSCSTSEDEDELPVHEAASTFDEPAIQEITNFDVDTPEPQPNQSVRDRGRSLFDTISVTPTENLPKPPPVQRSQQVSKIANEVKQEPHAAPQRRTLPEFEQRKCENCNYQTHTEWHQNHKWVAAQRCRTGDDVFAHHCCQRCSEGKEGHGSFCQHMLFCSPSPPSPLAPPQSMHIHVEAKLHAEVRQAKAQAALLQLEKDALIKKNENLSLELEENRDDRAKQETESTLAFNQLVETLNGASEPNVRRPRVGEESDNKYSDDSNEDDSDCSTSRPKRSGHNQSIHAPPAPDSKNIYVDLDGQTHISKVAFYDPQSHMVYSWHRTDGSGIDLPGGKRIKSDRGDHLTAIRICNETVLLPTPLQNRLYELLVIMSIRFTVVCENRHGSQLVSLWLVPATLRELKLIRQTPQGSKEGKRPKLRPLHSLVSQVYASAVHLALQHLKEDKADAQDASDTLSDDSTTTHTSARYPSEPKGRTDQNPTSSDSEEDQQEVAVMLASFQPKTDAYHALVLHGLNATVLCPAGEAMMDPTCAPRIAPPSRQGFTHTQTAPDANSRAQATAAAVYLTKALGKNLSKMISSTPLSGEITTNDVLKKYVWNHPKGGKPIQLRLRAPTDEDDPQSEQVNYYVWLVDDLKAACRKIRKVVRVRPEMLPYYDNLTIKSLTDSSVDPRHLPSHWTSCDISAFRELSSSIQEMLSQHKEAQDNKGSTGPDDPGSCTQKAIEDLKSEIESLKKQAANGATCTPTSKALINETDFHTSKIYDSPMTMLSSTMSSTDSDLYPTPTEEQMHIYRTCQHASLIEIILKRKFHPGVTQVGAHRFFLPRISEYEQSGMHSEKALHSFMSNRTLYPSARLGVGSEASKISLVQRAQAYNTYIMLLVPVLREAHAHGLPATSWLIRLRSGILSELSKREEDMLASSHNVCAAICQLENDRVLWGGMVQRAGGSTLCCTALLLDLFIELMGQTYVRATSGSERASQQRYLNFKRAPIGDVIECLRVLVDYYMLYKNPPNDPDNLSREQLWSSKEHTMTILDKLIETVGNDPHRPWSLSMKNYLRREIDDIHCLIQMGKATLADLAPNPNNLLLQKFANQEAYLESEYQRTSGRPDNKGTRVVSANTNNRTQNPTDATERSSESRRSQDRDDNSRNKNRMPRTWGRDGTMPEARVASVTQKWDDEEHDDQRYGAWDDEQKVAYVAPPKDHANTNRDYNKNAPSEHRPNQRAPYEQRQQTAPPPPPGGPPNYQLKNFNSHKNEPPPKTYNQPSPQGSTSKDNGRGGFQRDIPEVVHGGQRSSLIPKSWTPDQTKEFKSTYINLRQIDDLVGTSAAAEASKLRPLKPYDSNTPCLQATGEQNPPFKTCPDSNRRIWLDGSCNFCANTANAPENCTLPPTRQYIFGHYQSNHPSSKCYACKLSILYSRDERIRRAFAPVSLKDVRKPPENNA